MRSCGYPIAAFLPHRGADLYHTCYALSGLSIAQHAAAHGDLGKPPFVFGQRSTNLLEKTDFFYNVCCKQLEESRAQLSKMPSFEAPISKQKKQEGKGPALYAEWSAKFVRSPVNAADDAGEALDVCCGPPLSLRRTCVPGGSAWCIVVLVARCRRGMG